MILTRKRSHGRSRSAAARTTALAAICGLLALGACGSGDALGATSTTPTLPVPASAAAQSTTTSAAPPPSATQSATSPAAGAPHTTRAHARRPSKISSAAIALAALAGVIALACAAWALARFTAYEPRWVRSARHALAEGGFRASATWAEFSDWVRLGR